MGKALLPTTFRKEDHASAYNLFALAVSEIVAHSGSLAHALSAKPNRFGRSIYSRRSGVLIFSPQTALCRPTILLSPYSVSRCLPIKIFLFNGRPSLSTFEFLK